MALQIFAIRDRPHDFAVTKADVALAACVFRLDFGRPLVHVRMLLVGPLRTLLVPVAHEREHVGDYSIVVNRGEPYFADLPTLWEHHAAVLRPAVAGSTPAGRLDVLADFAKHFPTDALKALTAGPWRA